MVAGLSQDMRQPLVFKHHLVALAIYGVLTCIYFLNYLQNPAGFSGGGDDAVFANAFWWFKKCLVTLKNPFFADYLFYPDGMNLLFHTTTYSNFLLTLPLNLLFGVEVAVNGALLLGFVLSGYFCFLLVYELTGSLWGAIVAGLIFSFSPFHFNQGRGHLHISTLQWLPLYFLLLKQALEKGTVRLAMMTGGVLGLVILTDQLQTISAALVTVGLLLAAALSHPQSVRRGGRQIAIIGMTAATCASFYLYPLLRELLAHRAATKVAPLEHGGANTFSADILGFIVPGFHRLWGGAFSSFNLGKDSVVYVGFIALFLAGYGVWHCRKERAVRWAFLVAVCFWLMSLGTYLHVNGIWQFGSLRIPLPYLAMIDIPLLGENRTPCRFHLMTILAVAVLAGYGLRELFARMVWLPSKRHGVALVAIAALILLETMPPRQAPGETTIPALYTAMGKDPAAYSVLQLPLARWSALLKNGSGNPSIMMYYQTIHGKPIFSGLASRLLPEELDFKDPFLNLLVDVSAYDNQLAREKATATAQEYADMRRKGLELSRYRSDFLSRYRIGAIVIHAPISGDTLSRALLESFLGMKLQTDVAGGIAYTRTN